MSTAVTLRRLLRKRVQKSIALDQYWKDEIDKDPFLCKAVFCADLIFGDGRRLRVSTRPLTSIDQGGNIVAYNPQMIEDPKVSIAYDFKGGTASQRTINIEIDGRAIDPTSMVLAGDFLCGVGEISMQINGMNYEERYILIQGDMTGGIEFGANEETITLSIGDTRGSVDRIIPEAYTSKDGFPTLPDDQVGMRFPLVKTTARFIPAIRLSGNNYGPTVLVTAGTEYNIGAVYVDGDEVPATEQYFSGYLLMTATNWKQVNGQDNLGNSYTGVEFTTVSSPAYEGVSIYAGVYPKAERVMGILDIIENLVSDHTELGSSGYDYVLHARSVAKGGSTLRGEIVINASSSQNTASVFSYIESAICKEFPMLKAVYTGRGYGIVYTDRKSQTGRLSLVRGQGLLLDRIGSIKESPTEGIYNAFTLRYNYNALTDNYGSIISRSSDNSNLCAISEAKIGKREMQPIDSIIIVDDNTASTIIDWYVNHYTLPSYSVSYIGSVKLFFLVQIGDNILLTDDRLGLLDIPATIISLSVQDGQCEIQLQLWLQYKAIGG